MSVKSLLGKHMDTVFYDALSSPPWTCGTSRRIVPARASVHEMALLRELNRQGLVREASMRVAVTANRPFKLNVMRAGPSTSRVWVQDSAGRFQEIEPGPV